MDRIVRVFLSYAFTPRQNAYKQEEICRVLSDAVNSVEKKMQLRERGIEIVQDFALTEHGRVLRDEILKKIKSADIMIVDISDNNPNVLYELGYADALKMDSAIITKSTKEIETYEVPTDIDLKNRIQYDDVHELADKLVLPLERRVRGVLDAPPGPKDIRKIWFPQDASLIHVVGPKSQAKTEFADAESSDYDMLNKLGDKAAIFEVRILLAKLYPEAYIKVQMSDEFNMEADQADNMVIVGGPGIPGEDGNSVHRLFSDQMKLKISYTDDCEAMKIGDRQLSATYVEDKVTKDYGCFTRMRNPYNSASAVVMIHGIHTSGVLSASRMFGDGEAAKKNVAKVLAKLGDDPRFECAVGVSVGRGMPGEPELDEDFLIPR